jgi:hypothetical protein
MAAITHVTQDHGAGGRVSVGEGRRAREARGAGVVEGAILVAVAVLLIVGVIATSSRPVAEVPTAPVLAQRGDTLWTLAREHPVRGLTTEQVAEAIAKANDITGGRVVAGASILVPESRNTAAAVASR